jgi:hypothetical protein
MIYDTFERAEWYSNLVSLRLQQVEDRYQVMTTVRGDHQRFDTYHMLRGIEVQVMTTMWRLYRATEDLMWHACQADVGLFEDIRDTQTTLVTIGYSEERMSIICERDGPLPGLVPAAPMMQLILPPAPQIADSPESPEPFICTSPRYPTSSESSDDSTEEPTEVHYTAQSERSEQSALESEYWEARLRRRVRFSRRMRNAQRLHPYRRTNCVADTLGPLESVHMAGIAGDNQQRLFTFSDREDETAMAFTFRNQSRAE